MMRETNLKPENQMKWWLVPGVAVGLIYLALVAIFMKSHEPSLVLTIFLYITLLFHVISSGFALIGMPGRKSRWLLGGALSLIHLALMIYFKTLLSQGGSEGLLHGQVWFSHLKGLFGLEIGMVIALILYTTVVGEWVRERIIK